MKNSVIAVGSNTILTIVDMNVASQSYQCVKHVVLEQSFEGKQSILGSNTPRR